MLLPGAEIALLTSINILQLRASWNVIFVGFKDKNISNSGENGG
jgi:hypothetical protein